LKSYIIDPETLRLLLLMTKQTGARQSDIVRWAIRHYALTGPWSREEGDDRLTQLGLSGPLVTGPHFGEAK
jgi:hypothetical protein